MEWSRVELEKGSDEEVRCEGANLRDSVSRLQVYSETPGKPARLPRTPLTLFGTGTQGVSPRLIVDRTLPCVLHTGTKPWH